MTMMKRVICCFLAVMLLAGLLAGCGGKGTGQKTEKEERDSRPSSSVKEDKKETSHETVAPEVPAPLEEAKDLVTDAFWDVFEDPEYGDVYCYHIPQINLPGGEIETLNAEIYNMLYSILEQDVYSFESYPYVMGFAYTWSRQDDLLSLNIRVAYDWGSSDYYTYYVDVRECARLSEEVFLERWGLSASEYRHLLETNLERFFLEMYEEAYESYKTEDYFVELYQSQYEKTLSRENLDAAMPYIDEKGDLCCVAQIFSMAGADSYPHLINLSGGEDMDYFECDGNHENAQPEKPDETPAPVAGMQGVAEEVYAGFVAEEAYLSVVDNSGLCGDVTEYAILDVDQDGIPELFLNSGDGMGFFLAYIFTMDPISKEVHFLTSIYNYGGLAYSERDRCITYCYPRPTAMEGGRDFYRLEDGEFVRTYGLYFTNYSDYRLVEYGIDGSIVSDTALTEDEWNEWMAADLSLEWAPIG